MDGEGICGIFEDALINQTYTIHFFSRSDIQAYLQFDMEASKI